MGFPLLARALLVVAASCSIACGSDSPPAGDPYDPNAASKGDDPDASDTDGDPDPSAGGSGTDEACPDDPNKSTAGQCGCGTPDDDGDDDGVADCVDACPDDGDKDDPGTCGCGVSDDDADTDGLVDCEDNCADDSNASQDDQDGDGVGDACDNCLDIPNADQEADATGEGAACSCGPAPLPCVDGLAGGLYDCSSVDMLARLSLEDLGASVASDLWGWTDPDTSREYALLGVNHGTVFVDVTHPYCPRHVGTLPTATSNGPLRDIKVFDNHAFIVAEANGHGMQVFDLTRLRGVTEPETFDADANYTNFGSAHNVIVDPDAGFAYAVGSGTCDAGLHIVDVRDPLDPQFAGCFSDVGYIHDAQCVIYDGPDTEHAGTEICVIFNGGLGSISVLDMETKDQPVELSRTEYSGASFAHQGWLTEDHAYLLLNDEFDESNQGHYTKTYIWDVRDLDAPTIIGDFQSENPATDHNLMTHNGLAFEANYRGGMRVLDLAEVSSGSLSEVAYFDTDPTGDGPQLDGAFTAFPYYDSGIVIISDMSRGVFVVRPDVATETP